MLGAVIGDIVGSVYEFDNIRTKDFLLFREDCKFTDDTVMTCAVAEALIRGGKADDFVDAFKSYGARYPDAGYGGGFNMWLHSKDSDPYNSYGNGAAMRVSPCAWLGHDEATVTALAEASAVVTHNHPEGIKGAKATAAAIYFARMGKNKAEIKELIEGGYGYDLSRTLYEIRPSYKFNETCQKTVPEAIVAFLESTGFEDAIRNAISLGGDSDTLAAITGSIAEAAYGIPTLIAEKALGFLDAHLTELYWRWCDFRINCG